MSLIFFLSSLSSLPDFEDFEVVVKKAAHFTVYAFLYLLLFRAFRSMRPEESGPARRVYVIAAVVAVLYAISDEVHQSFVPLRTATMRDVLIDTGGIALMCLLIAKLPAFFGPILRWPPAQRPSP
jgi:VanZ family protein